MRNQLFLFFLFIGLFSFAQEDEYRFYSLKEQQLNGPVKSASLTSFSAKPDGKGGYVKVAPGFQYFWQKNNTILYNPAGGTVSVTEFPPDGQTVTKMNFIYLKGILSEVQMPATAEVFEYDDNGRLAMCGQKSTVEGDNGFYAFFKYEYNAANKLARVTETDGEGNWQGGTIYTYDPKGNLISLKEDYDAGYTETYTYNAENQLIRMVLTDEEGTQETTTYVYNGKEMTETWQDYGVYPGKVIYSYEDGLEVKTVEYDGATLKETQVTTYEFDSKGNWIRKVVAINNKTFFIEERVIDYY